MRQSLFTALLLTVLTTTTATAQLTISTMNKEFQTDALGTIIPLKGTDEYVRASDDGTQIVQCSFSSGKQTAVLFDINNTQGATIDAFDDFIVSADGSKLLLATNTEHIYRYSAKADYYLYTVHSRRLEPLSDGGKQQSPQFSPDGNQIAFVRDNNIYLVKLLYDNAESAVTKDGVAHEVINGAPDWVYEEEFMLKTAFCFNADGTKLCWLRFDESAVPTYYLPRYNDAAARGTTGTCPEELVYKYPAAGQNNAIVTAWSYDIKSHRTQQLQIPSAESDYMPRLLPTDDPERIIVYTLNRAQDNLCLYAVNPGSTLAQLLVQEKGDKYIPGDVVLKVKVTNSAILLPSDRSGYTHLYIYNMNGQQVREIGADSEIITDIYAYNDATGDAYYQIAPTPFDRYVAVSHKTGKTEALTDTNGWNVAKFSATTNYFLNTWSDMNTPYVVTARNNKGKTLATIYDNAALVDKMQRNGWNRREMFSFTTPDGVTLNGWMLRPATTAPSPVIMYQYGGPGSQQVVNAWHCASMGQGYDYYLAQQGYIVVCVDNRGTGGRGAAFEKSVYQHLGVAEATDQVEAARWLAQQSYVDKDHIGVWGWSYGGFNTLMAMSEGRPVFACGVAVAPVTSWRYYDSVYTERYMRTPQENAQGYNTCPLSRVSDLSGALLLCHGTLDDNVHPQNTFEFTDALVAADKDFTEVFYTNRNHSIYGGNARPHIFRQITNFFDAHLKGSSSK